MMNWRSKPSCVFVVPSALPLHSFIRDFIRNVYLGQVIYSIEANISQATKSAFYDCDCYQLALCTAVVTVCIIVNYNSLKNYFFVTTIFVCNFPFPVKKLHVLATFLLILSPVIETDYTYSRYIHFCCISLNTLSLICKTIFIYFGSKTHFSLKCDHFLPLV